MIDPADLDDDPVEEAPLPPSPLDDLVRFRFRRADWIDDAACRDTPTSVFYPERGEELDAARAVCADCPVKADCLDHAVALNEKFGVWGGTSERQRRRIRSTRRSAS